MMYYTLVSVCQDTFNRYDVNKGYIYYPVPVEERIEHPKPPFGVHLKRPTCVPLPPYKRPEPTSRDVFLWHSVPGSLIHCRHYPPPPADRQFFVDDCMDRLSRR